MTTFAKVVKSLTDQGMESYRADFVRSESTFYFPNGDNYTKSIEIGPFPIAANFSAEALVIAIRASQHGEIEYPEFVACATAAGVTSYVVFLLGKRCIYFGRKGEIHVEAF